MEDRPPTSVTRAFGLGSDVEPLAGGYETSVVVSDVVLKQVMNLNVAVFCQDVLSQISCPSIVIPAPLRAASGEWSAEGWTATRFVEGLTPARQDPALLVAVGGELATALAKGDPIDDQPVRDRSDRWAMAERFVFDEIEISISAETQRIVRELRARIDGDDTDQIQLIHADLAGNVFVDPNGKPVVLDFTPACRSVGFQSGVIIADTLLWGDGLWGDGSTDHVNLLDGDTGNLARGLLFRLAAAELAPGPGNADSERCERVLADLGWL